MGTSSNQSSPRTPNWRLAHAVLGRPDVDAPTQSQELWRAAQGDQGEALLDGLGSSLLAAACNAAAKAENPSQAMRTFEQSLIEQKAAGIFLDLGMRALAKSVAAKTGEVGFASELFAEATAYYASRDLPSFVAAAGRLSTTSDSIQLKDRLRSIAREAALNVPLKTDPKGWRAYVSKVLRSLQEGSK
jgi:hypothetical protein